MSIMPEVAKRMRPKYSPAGVSSNSRCAAAMSTEKMLANRMTT